MESDNWTERWNSKPIDLEKHQLCLVQVTQDAKYQDEIALYFGRHVSYCTQWKYDYWLRAGLVRYSPHVAWDKLMVVIEAMLAGYKYVVYMDTDAYVSDTSQELKRACVQPVSAVRWVVPIPHYQAGVLYFNNEGGRALFILQRMCEEAKYWLEMQPTIRGWYEQGLLNYFAKGTEFAKDIGNIPMEWNYGVPYGDKQPCEKPVVKSWHGVPKEERYQLMKAELEKELGYNMNGGQIQS